VLATAGGLVFYVQPNGGFAAVDERDGKTFVAVSNQRAHEGFSSHVHAAWEAVCSGCGRPEHFVLRAMSRLGAPHQRSILIRGPALVVTIEIIQRPI
jgi:hypothetical protein